MLVKPLAVIDTVLGCAIEVHRSLGPGLLESAYAVCLAHELTLRGVPFRHQVAVPVNYKGTRLDCGYRVDFLIADEIVVELKSMNEILPIHQAQVITYLKLLGMSQGLLVNFNVTRLMDGVRRIFA